MAYVCRRRFFSPKSWILIDFDVFFWWFLIFGSIFTYFHIILCIVHVFFTIVHVLPYIVQHCSCGVLFLLGFDRIQISFWPWKWSRLATESLSETCPKFDLGKKSVQYFSCAGLLVAPLPPITCSGKPAPKSDKGNVGTDDELKSRVGEHKNSAWDLHGQCYEIHDFR